MITEIEVEGIGMIRIPNMWQWHRLKRVRGPNRDIAQLAAAACMSIKQFKSLPIEKQQEVWRAYRALTSMDNSPVPARTQDDGPMLTKGIHRTDAEKIKIGRMLLGKKAELQRGHFGPWLEKQGIPKGFAQAVMKMAKAA